MFFIKKYLSSLRIEESDHRQLFSWKPCVTNWVDINFSSLSKKEETIVHIEQLKHICFSQRNNLVIYSNGSKYGKTGFLKLNLQSKHLAPHLHNTVGYLQKLWGVWCWIICTRQSFSVSNQSLHKTLPNTRYMDLFWQLNCYSESPIKPY